MTDKEKIEQAADKVFPAEWMNYYFAKREGFKVGAEWRDKNPSPEVLALIEAARMYITLAQSARLENNSQRAVDTYSAVSKALAAVGDK